MKLPRRQPGLDEVPGGERPTRRVEHAHPSAFDVTVVVEITQVLVQHLADEPLPLHERQGLGANACLVEGQLAGQPADLPIPHQTLRGRPFALGFDAAPGLLKMRPHRSVQVGARHSVRQGPPRHERGQPFQGRLQRLRRLGGPARAPLLAFPVRLDLLAVLAVRGRGRHRRNGGGKPSGRQATEENPAPEGGGPTR